MAQKVTISFKLDKDTKEGMEQVCSELGLSMKDAFTVFAKTVCRERRIPFELTIDPFYSERNIQYLENVQKDMAEGKAHFEEHDLIEE